MVAPSVLAQQYRLAALAAVSAFSVLPPVLAPLDVPDSVEVVDHAIPGALALVATALAAVLHARDGSASAAAFAALGAAALCGAWEALTHLTLVADAGEPGREAGAAALHAAPGPVMLALALWLLLSPPVPAGR